MGECKLAKQDYIEIKGARVHNLKNIDVKIPRNKFVVITGLSGSGKSSLAFDTLYADGQRRYIESLSSYARQFMGRMSKPEVDKISGISPAIAIEQKVNTRNPRSTVGTSTEIYEYLKLLFSRIGKTYSPISGKIVKRHKTQDVLNFVEQLAVSTRFMITAPVVQHANRTLSVQLNMLMQHGFSRLLLKGKIMTIEDALKIKNLDKKKAKDFYIVIDRLARIEDFNSIMARVADSVQTAFYEGEGVCRIFYEKEKKFDFMEFSNRFELDGMEFEEPSLNFFSFNNPYGACRRCEGYGSVVGIDPDLVIPDKNLSVFEGAIAPWKGEKMGQWKDRLVMAAMKFDFPIHRPYYLLTDEEKELLWTGNEYFEGLNAFFEELEQNAYKIQYRVMLSRYRGKTVCPDCRGSRLRKETNFVKISGKTITDIVLMSVDEVLAFFNNLELDKYDLQVAKRIILEITNRLQVLNDVGLSYLSLNRRSNTLSGGESQRINLATSLGSSLVGSIYILDEPSIGLHPRDTERLIVVLKRLRDIGNTVIVVEHDETIMRAADHIIDIGPAAGSHGGEVVYEGNFDNMLSSSDSLTAQYLTKKMEIPIPSYRRNWKSYVEVRAAEENNLKKIDVKIPLNVMTLITGVSGSGKTTLIKGILYPALKKILGGQSTATGKHAGLFGDFNQISDVEMIDQNPIGRSSRSNPVTYIKAFDDIRSLYASQKLAKMRNYKSGYFSFNVEGGRCEQCQGEGVIKVEMQFMADIYLKCEHCNGSRYKSETKDVKFEGKDISELLQMTVADALGFFKNVKQDALVQRIVNKLQVLDDVGLSYVQLGQSSNTLSGGEAQRIKLAYYLSKGKNSEKLLFIFDEPTTGLHFHDINKLYSALSALIKIGHSVVIIEHNTDLIRCADWVIDLGLEGGSGGGNVIFKGVPEDLVKNKKSFTAQYIQL
ncbi:MAG: excinuclease ABC subunit A [Bacteroidetes bacterium]|nr:MAG: excinuclease ABC subunit A [Bacteroidota bacterium]